MLLLAPQLVSAASYRVLHQFCGHQSCRDGFDLSAPVVRDAQGNLYGTAFEGGKFGGGTVYRLRAGAKGRWNLEVLHDFCHEDACIDGLTPQSAVIVDAEGNLYGVTTIPADQRWDDVERVGAP